MPKLTDKQLEQLGWTVRILLFVGRIISASVAMIIVVANFLALLETDSIEHVMNEIGREFFALYGMTIAVFYVLDTSKYFSAVNRLIILYELFAYLGLVDYAFWTLADIHQKEVVYFANAAWLFLASFISVVQWIYSFITAKTNPTSF